MNLIYHSEFSSIYFEEHESGAIIRWKPLGIICDKEWKESFEAGIQFYARNVQQYKQIDWLNDTTEMQAVSKESTQWLLEYSHSWGLTCGHPKLAFVKSRYPLGMASLKLYIVSSCKLNPGILHGLFDTVDDAREWLKEHKGVVELAKAA